MTKGYMIAAFCSVSNENMFHEIWQNDLAAAKC